MVHLWYDLEEVNHFHPQVENALNRALVNINLSGIAEVIHHPTIPNSTTIPDFAVRLRSNNRYIFIVEVKRTQRDVESQRFQNQTRSYVTDFGAYWENSYYKYFCITNVERLLLFADRQGAPITNCLLKNNPFQHTVFNPDDHDATQSINELQLTFENILQSIFNRNDPEWDNTWELVITSFYNNYEALRDSIHYPVNTSKELSLYEFFRLLAYAYLKDYYLLINSPNTSYFRGYPPNNTNLKQFINQLSNNFARVVLLDFRQIFSDHPNTAQRIFPNNLTEPQLRIFKELIHYLALYNQRAVADNPSPSYIYNLITSKIYNHLELASSGKIMSDTELSNLLAVLCIDSQNSEILDPGCGDGALLDASYDRLSYLATSSRNPKTHNELLSQVNGIEIDPFLSQLAAFRLLSKNLIQIEAGTDINILNGDIFSNPRPNRYDVVLMNPPFLRNDNPESPITVADKRKMRNAIEGQNLEFFVSRATQPNLYFYFVNYIWHYLRENGKAGVILMTKFLNNEDGEILKAFLLDKVEAIISYPRKYFQEFVVSTVIVILKKGNNSDNVLFLRVTDEFLLLSPENLRELLDNPANTVTPSYKLRLVSRKDLDASTNWREYLNDRNYDDLLNLPLLSNIRFHFGDISRGGAENNGGSKLIFPTFDEDRNLYVGLGERLTKEQSNEGVQQRKIDIPASLNGLVSYGIKNNFNHRNYTLTLTDLEYEKAIHFPQKADRITDYGLPQEEEDVGMLHFYSECSEAFVKWKKIINSAYNSTFIPKIIIPRADRTKHVVYYNPHEVEITLTTNFLYCNNLQNYHHEIDEESQYKFIAAFLISVFGQIQFELNANNQEGCRKLEGFQLMKFKIPNLTMLRESEVTSVLCELDRLDSLGVPISGAEGLRSPRRELDLSIARIIYSRANLGFNTLGEMVDYFELFLADLVEDRSI